MGQLALGLVGAGVGFMVGGPAGASMGWALGGFAWSLFDRQKIQGPRLQDTKVKGADYGVMRTILYGTARIGGIGMGQGSTENGPNEFTEHEETSGGNGGPEITNFRYTLSFFNEICEGPIIGVRRRWANARLTTDATAPSSDIWPYTLYLGSATQTPDPTMETIYGVGEVNPMRGVAYESVEELDMTDYGNARPVVEYEAFTAAGDIPWRVSTFAPWATHGTSTNRGATYVNGVITVSSTSNLGDFEYYHQTFNLAGEAQSVEITTTNTGYNATTGGGKVRNLNVVVGGTGPDSYWMNPDPNVPGNLIPGAHRATGLLGNACVYMNDYIYTPAGVSGGFQTIARLDSPGGVGGSDVYLDIVSLDSNYTSSNVYLGTSDTGHLYVMVDTGGGAIKLWKYSDDLTLVHFWDTTDTAGTLLQSRGNFHVYNGLLAYYMEEGGVDKIALVRINGDDTLSDYGVRITSAGTNEEFCANLAGGLCIDQAGVFSLDPPPGSAILGDIVSDLCQRAGLTTGQIDVTDLTQEVRGFVVGSQMTVKNAIDILRQAFFFDATECDGKLLFRNRGHDATDTIPDEDLCAHVPGTEKPEPLETTRVPEAELPRTVYINFYDVDHDYQQGSQYWRRTVTSSQSDVTLDLPICFTASEALLRAQWHLHFAWLERDRFTFYLTDEWCKLRPTNVIVVRGVNVRLTNITEMPDGILRCEAVRAFAGPYTSPITDPGSGSADDGEIPGGGGGGQPPQDPPTAKADSAVILIDGPWTDESDSPYGVKAALYKSSTGAWPGASLYRSIDGGTTYAAVASTSSQATFGTVATALGDFLGGNVVDEAHIIRVSLWSQTATLSSTTTDGLLNGLNLIALGTVAGGWEFLQFRTATLVSAGVYDLSGLRRGRFGTEWKMGDHGASEILVLMSTTVSVPGSMAEIGVSRKFKAVTSGTALADATAQDFTNTGVALKALAPVLLGGGRDAGGDLTLNFTPRRRGSGGWPSGADLPATDPVNWQIEIFTDGTYTTNVRAIGVTVTTYEYTAADQTTDFGSPQSTVYWRVAQLCAVGLGYFAEAST